MAVATLGGAACETMVERFMRRHMCDWVNARTMRDDRDGRDGHDGANDSGRAARRLAAGCRMRVIAGAHGMNQDLFVFVG